MIEPGDVYELPERLARPPQTAYQDAPAVREARWVVVVSSATTCAQARFVDVIVVLFSRQVDHAGENDVKIYRGDGGVEHDSIAQADLVFTIAKQDLAQHRWRGRVQADTLVRIRAVLATIIGIAPSA